MSSQEAGPGVVSADDVGTYTIARTQLLDSRFTMAYAAAINDPNPAYFDDTRAGGLAVHPGICFSLQWASRFRPGQPLNMRAAPYGVHASTDFRIHRPFRAGEAITTQGRMVQKRQIRPGVFALERYRMISADGELVAELDYNGITRGATLEGDDRLLEPDPELPVVSIGSGTPLWRREIEIAAHAAQQYTECAQIYNPIHTEKSVALAAGLPDIILHGSATKAMSLTAVVDACFDGDATKVIRLVGQLRGMVLMRSTMVVEALSNEVIDGERRVAFRTLNDAGQPAIDGGVVIGRV